MIELMRRIFFACMGGAGLFILMYADEEIKDNVFLKVLSKYASLLLFVGSILWYVQ